MQLTKNLIYIFFACFILQACYYDVEEELYPTTGACDTTNVTLISTVRPILKMYCYVCHSTANATSSGAGIDLENYTTLAVQASNGQLVNSINHTGGIPPMPKGASSKIPSCDILKIEQWVKMGYKNN